jgi:competence protein ComGC
MPSDFERAARRGFGFTFGAMIAVIIVVCLLILILTVFSLIT